VAQARRHYGEWAFSGKKPTVRKSLTVATIYLTTSTYRANRPEASGHHSPKWRL
jgi:hypothetical protein